MTDVFLYSGETVPGSLWAPGQPSHLSGECVFYDKEMVVCLLRIVLEIVKLSVKYFNQTAQGCILVEFSSIFCLRIFLHTQ